MDFRNRTLVHVLYWGAFGDVGDFELVRAEGRVLLDAFDGEDDLDRIEGALDCDG